MEIGRQMHVLVQLPWAPVAGCLSFQTPIIAVLSVCREVPQSQCKRRGEWGALPGFQRGDNQPHQHPMAMLGTTPTMPGTTPTMLGTTPPHHPTAMPWGAPSLRAWREACGQKQHSMFAVQSRCTMVPPRSPGGGGGGSKEHSHHPPPRPRGWVAPG